MSQHCLRRTLSLFRYLYLFNFTVSTLCLTLVSFVDVFPCDKGSTLETLDFAFYIGSTTTFLYFDLLFTRYIISTFQNTTTKGSLNDPGRKIGPTLYRRRAFQSRRLHEWVIYIGITNQTSKISLWNLDHGNIKSDWLKRVKHPLMYIRLKREAMFPE